ncbi:MAG: capsular biosynthesis protein CpsG [Erysipelotrichia bacterium]|nr:capsular biosynthesis protein CpsG [Erysipelotrichia bacterium]
MILICVGASEYGLDRLLRYIDELCDEGFFHDETIVAQKGNAKYQPRNYTSFDLIGRADFQKYIDQSDIIITHAGTGSVIPPLKQGKKIIVFPRLQKYKEHVDDHQLELANVFSEGGYTLYADDKESLKKALIDIKKFKPKTFVSNKGVIDNIIIDFLESEH